MKIAFIATILILLAAFTSPHQVGVSEAAQQYGSVSRSITALKSMRYLVRLMPRFLTVEKSGFRRNSDRLLSCGSVLVQMEPSQK